MKCERELHFLFSLKSRASNLKPFRVKIGFFLAYCFLLDTVDSIYLT